jgi:hypothetical protein
VALGTVVLAAQFSRLSARAVNQFNRCAMAVI